MNNSTIVKRLRDAESRLALQEDLIDVVEKAFDLIPTQQLAQGHMWGPSPEAVVLLALAKNRIKEHKELLSVLFEEGQE